MKKLFDSIISGISITYLFIFTSCVPDYHGYEEKDGEIYHKWFHGGNWTKEKTLVDQADASTFTTIQHEINIDLGKDKNHVFIDALILENADPLTFEQIKEYYWRDKNQVYLLGFGRADKTIEYADPKTFTLINNNEWVKDKKNVFNKLINLWAKDKSNVYFMYNKLNGVNPKEFVSLDEDWGKDDSFYFYHDLKLDSLDYKTAQIVSSSYIKDKNRVFFQNKLVKDANPSTFKADGVGSFGHDNKYMFDWEKNKGFITEEYRKTYINRNKI